MPVIAAVAAPFVRDLEECLARIARLLEQARAAGAELVVLPESALGFASANQTGAWGPLRFLGGARVVDPDGVVLARTQARPGIAVAEADLGEIRRSRAAIDHLADLRPGAYDPLASSGADVRDRRRIRSL